jgi:four helix bundle protein
MKSENVIQVKSFAFAVKIVKTTKELIAAREFVLGRQLMRSGTSIGANVEEAIGAQSRADFIHKLSIAYKEARETVYWTRLLRASGLLTEEKAQELKADAEELCRIIGSIQVAMKSRR